MKWTTDNIGNLDGKVTIVTGANSGIGYYTTLELAKKGATVVMACRNMAKAESAAKGIKAEVKNAQLDIRKLDLADLESVHSFAEGFKKDYRKLDILINNAGLMAIPESRTKQGFEMQFGTNHLGHFALTLHLSDILTKTENSRIVTVSSIAHRIGTINFTDLNWNSSYKKWAAYGQSKLANLMFTIELQRRLEEKGASTIAVAAHPGYADTNLQTKGAIIEGSEFKKAFFSLANNLAAQPAAMGALPSLYAATAHLVEGGKFYGPNKLGGFRGYPREEKINEKKVDKVVAKKLWEVSEDLTGVRFEI